MSDLGHCISTIHEDEKVDAVVEGIFDCSDMNGKPPSRVRYCRRCAYWLERFGYFTPDGAEP